MAIGERMTSRSSCRALRVLLLAGILGAAASALSQEISFHADASKSQVEFILGDVLHTVHGTFRLKEGSLQMNPVAGKVHGAITVDTASGNTGNDTRDHKMQKDILESAKYPEIRFVVQSMQGSLSLNGGSEVKLAGVMFIHGGEHPLTVIVPVQIANGQATADVHFVVPYVQWGMKDPSTFILRVSKEVDITVHLVGSVGPAQ
jgi:polyisoprenoid-binding protein YceI